MARVVVLGAGVAGHTAALHLRRKLGRDHDVIVVSPNANWNWIPSNIWVGVGLMKPAQVVFPLAPVYARAGIEVAISLAPVHGRSRTASTTPIAGAITIGGTDLRHMQHEERAAHMALVPQDPSLFHLSLSDNIRYGRPDASDGEVREAAIALVGAGSGDGGLDSGRAVQGHALTVVVEQR